MLDRATNELLTQTSHATPMGQLLRRYWMPIAAVSEFDSIQIKPVRLMGEELVLYKDLSGKYGLIDRQCAHRRADLAQGFVETGGLRCAYHGWCFDQAGRCVEQPYEDVAHLEVKFKEKIRLKSYAIEQRAGLLWAYLGPEPQPLVPNWEPFTWANGFVQIVFAEIPCNWFQCQENSIDPVHFEWQHMNWSTRLAGKTGPYSPRHLKVAFEEFEYGFTYRRMREGMAADDALWTVGRCCLWPNMLFTGNHFEWRVPMDDTRTLSVTWAFSRVPHESEPYVQMSIPAWSGEVKDGAGNWISSHVMNQDFIAWTGQGVIADRTLEHLGPSDRGIILQRKRFLDDLEAIAQGRDPKATVRDEAVNQCIALPVADRELLTKGLSREQLKQHPTYGRHLLDYPFQQGQPAEVRRAFVDAMGI